MDMDYRGNTDHNFSKIVEHDKVLIDQCDVVLVHHMKPSVGTSMEILYAWERGKHIVVICPHKVKSPWINYHAHAIFPDIHRALNHLRKILHAQK